MSTLAETLHDDMIAALRAHDDLVVSTLRMALTAVKTEEVAGKTPRELSDGDVLAVLAKESKKRREAAEMFATGDRAELADKELAEAAILDRYLPAQLTDAELAELVTSTIAETGATGPQGLGLVMKTLTPVVAGRADGKRLSAEVRRQLTT
ncbi:GatB/YqeY domain-containing protein [Acidothermaceae bacterium B102]|nr:GatB/YqeY domain-containing protein [Acidothermaceae bacterium B102]